MKKVKIMSLLLSLFCTMSVASLAHAENNTVTNGQVVVLQQVPLLLVEIRQQAPRKTILQRH